MAKEGADIFFNISTMFVADTNRIGLYCAPEQKCALGSPVCNVKTGCYKNQRTIIEMSKSQKPKGTI